MYARSTTIQADPGRVPEVVGFVRDEVLPGLDAETGWVGLSMLVEPESGRCITTTAWRDVAAMQGSESAAGPLRKRAAELGGAADTVSRWEIAVLHRSDRAGEGAWVRVTWTRSDTDRVQRAIDTYRTTLLPAIEDLGGFRSASLLVDRGSGNSVSSVTYDDRDALERSREAAKGLRRSAVQENDVQILDVAEFELVLAHLRVPETV